MSPGVGSRPKKDDYIAAIRAKLQDAAPRSHVGVSMGNPVGEWLQNPHLAGAPTAPRCTVCNMILLPNGTCIDGCAAVKRPKEKEESGVDDMAAARLALDRATAVIAHFALGHETAAAEAANAKRARDSECIDYVMGMHDPFLVLLLPASTTYGSISVTMLKKALMAMEKMCHPDHNKEYDTKEVTAGEVRARLSLIYEDGLAKLEDLSEDDRLDTVGGSGWTTSLMNMIAIARDLQEISDVARRELNVAQEALGKAQRLVDYLCQATSTELVTLPIPAPVEAAEAAQSKAPDVDVVMSSDDESKTDDPQSDKDDGENLTERGDNSAFQDRGRHPEDAPSDEAIGHTRHHEGDVPEAPTPLCIVCK